jgi:HlyD family secretion protein
MRRLFFWLVVVAVLAGGAGAAGVPVYQWWKKRITPRYLTAKVSRGQVEAVVNSTGTVNPVRSVKVGAFVSGPILKLFVDFNSPVKEGQLIARIDPKLPKAAVERDQAAIDRDYATLATQKADLARIDALLEQAKNNEMRAIKLQSINKDYISEQEMDQFHFTRKSYEAQKKLVLAAIDQANAAIKLSKANLKNSQASLDYTEIKSPTDGIVVERKVDEGQTVAASFQTPELFNIAVDLDKKVHIFANVDEADIGQITAARQQKRPVSFTVDAYPQDVFHGTIEDIRKNSTTTQNVVTYPVVIAAPNTGKKLFPGMTANISFQIEVRDNVLRVPTAALRFTPPPARVHPDDKKYLDGLPVEQPESGVRLSASQKAALARSRSRRLVWVQEGELLRAVSVTLGISDGQFAEVLNGELAEGQEVVTGIEGVVERNRR